MKTVYYGRISTTEGQTSASQYEDALAQSVDTKHTHIDEGISGYHVSPLTVASCTSAGSIGSAAAMMNSTAP
jgi:hypothetical protein